MVGRMVFGEKTSLAFSWKEVALARIATFPSARSASTVGGVLAGDYLRKGVATSDAESISASVSIHRNYE